MSAPTGKHTFECLKNLINKYGNVEGFQRLYLHVHSSGKDNKIFLERRSFFASSHFIVLTPYWASYIVRSEHISLTLRAFNISSDVDVDCGSNRNSKCSYHHWRWVHHCCLQKITDRNEFIVFVARIFQSLLAMISDKN